MVVRKKEGGAHFGNIEVRNQCECSNCRPGQGRSKWLTPATARSGPRWRKQEPKQGGQDPAAEIQQQLATVSPDVGKNNFLNISDHLSIEQGEFEGGVLSKFYDRWRLLTKDPEILQWVRGAPLNFLTPPVQSRLPHEIIFDHQEATLVKAELNKFLDQGIVDKSSLHPGDFCSNLFARPKKTPGAIRLILSLKKLNKFVKYVHFKMETLQTVLLLLKPGAYMTSIDLSQSFYHVKVRDQDQKFLKFLCLGDTWVMKSLPMGYRDAPRVFTRLMKVPMYYLRHNLGVLCSHFIDDVITLSDTKPQAVVDTAYTGNTLSFCGFHINLPKSVTDPCQLMDHLGFNINSVSMTLHLLLAKAEKIVKLAKALLSAPGGVVCIRQVAQFVGCCIAATPALEYGPFHTKELEISKTRALNANGWNFDGHMTLHEFDLSDIAWWAAHVRGAFSFILPTPVDLDLFSDASNTGWGGYCQQSGATARGMFGPDELDLHINVKELLACFLTVKIFLQDIFDQHIHLHLDSQVALGCIRAQGSTRSPMCNKYTAKIMRFFEGHRLHLTTTYIQSSCNDIADSQSRQGANDDIEWTLVQQVFDKIADFFTTPEVDLFANRLNHRLPKYVSWHRDPGAMAVDALNICWTQFKYMYVFCPFSLIPRVLSKVQRTAAVSQLLMVVPLWPGQIWWPALMDMLVSPIILLPSPQKVLFLPHKPTQKHHMDKLTLIAVKISKCKILQHCFLKELEERSPRLVHKLPMHNIKPIGRDGWYIAHRTMKIPIFPVEYTQ